MIKNLLGSSKRYLLNLLDNPAVVLLYHRVANLENDPQALAVSPGNFYEQIALLKKHYNLLNVEEFTEILKHKRKIPRNAVVITFDDGYADNYLEALPILKTLDSQALFYITTSNLNTDHELWWDELERIILNNYFLSKSLEVEINGRITRFPISNPVEKVNTYNFLHPYFKYLLPQQRNKIIDELRQSMGMKPQGRESHRLLTNNEIQQLSESSAAVLGAHTHNHPALSTLSYDIQLQEIELSKNILEKSINKKIVHFSYPYGGKKDYNNDTLKICREIGFEMVCSNYYGQVHSWTDILQLPRILVRDWSQQFFKNFIAKSFRY